MEITLGKRIVQNRKRLGLTQDQLAEKLGVTAQAVSKWENDQSCPDITILPKLAGIFHVTTDELLGHEPPPAVHQAEVVEEDEESHIGGHVGNWEFSFDGGRKGALSFALFVLICGGLLLLSRLLSWNVSFWEILWPTAILTFGLFGLFPKFSFFQLGCVLVGAYFLLGNLGLLPSSVSGELIFPALVILFGLSLLVDALKKPRKSTFKMFSKGSKGKQKSDYYTDGESFCFNGSFGENRQDVAMPRLSDGKICVSFGSFVVDLSEVESVSQNCQLEANCSFGELTILVPARFRVQSNGATAFAEIHIDEHNNGETQGVIQFSGNASFGSISVEYI